MQEHRRAVRDIAAQLGGLNLAELLPPDTEAIEHAKEHVHADIRVTTAIDADLEMEEGRRTWENAQVKLEELRQRLNAILDDLGLSPGV